MVKRDIREAPHDGSAVTVQAYIPDGNGTGYYVTGTGYFDGRVWRWRENYTKCYARYWLEHSK